MTIYRHKLEEKVQAKNSDRDPATDNDESSADDDGMDSYLVKTDRPSMFFRRRRSILAWFISVLLLFVILFILGTIFWYRMPSNKSIKPYVELVRMRYHIWKENAAGVKRSFKVEGEFYQQVEIDVEHEAYEKLNVPPVMNMQRSSILHDFVQKLTTIVSLDHGCCLILPLNYTYVKPLKEFYQLVKNNKDGYDSTDPELVSDDYRLLSVGVRDVSQFGQHIHRHCQHLETYRLVRDDEPLIINKRSSCRFRGKQFCLGSAGTEYMGAVHINQCVH